MAEEQLCPAVVTCIEVIDKTMHNSSCCSLGKFRQNVLFISHSCSNTSFVLPKYLQNEPQENYVDLRQLILCIDHKV